MLEILFAGNGQSPLRRGEDKDRTRSAGLRGRFFRQSLESAQETAMTERDSDIEWFEDLEPDEPTPPEDSQRGQRPPRGGPPRKSVRRPTGIAPLLRLAGLIAFAILVVILLVFWVQSCRGASKKHAYETYMVNARSIGRSSTQIGIELTNVLTTPGLKALQTADEDRRPRSADGAAAWLGRGSVSTGPASGRAEQSCRVARLQGEWPTWSGRHLP